MYADSESAAHDKSLQGYEVAPPILAGERAVFFSGEPEAFALEALSSRSPCGIR